MVPLKNPLPAVLALFSLFPVPALQPAAAASVKIEKVLPFATATQVRVQTTVRSDQKPAGVELIAEITPATDGEDATPLWSGPLGKVDAPRGGAGATTEQVVDVGPFKPHLWSLATPALYTLKITATQGGR